MGASIEMVCPEGHATLTYTGKHGLDDDEAHVRETGVPDEPRCGCGRRLVEVGGRDE